MASGMPSSRLQISLDRLLRAGRRQRTSGVTAAGTLHEQALRRRSLLGIADARSRAGRGMTAHRRRRGPRDWSRARGRQDTRAAARSASAAGRVEEVLTVVEHHERTLRREVRRGSLAFGRQPRPGRDTECSRDHLRHAASSIAERCRARSSHAPSRKSGSISAATWSDRRVFPTPPTPVSVTMRERRTSAAIDATLVFATDERRELQREVPRVRIERPQRRELGREPGGITWYTRSGSRQIAQAVFTEIDEHDMSPSSSSRRLLGGERHDDLAAVGRHS